MIVIEKNEGTKIGFDVTETKICFADELMINLAKIQKDDPVHKDICFDSEGDLVIGTESGKYYVAEIDVPGIEYEEVENQEAVEGSEMGGNTTLVAKPLDMDKVTLTLWSIDERTKIEEVA